MPPVQNHKIINYKLFIIVLVCVIIAVVITYYLLKHEKFSSIMTVDSTGNLAAADSIDIVNLSIKGNFGTEGQVVSSSGPGNAVKWTSGLTRYIGSTSESVPPETFYPQGATVITMLLSELTPGNKLIITANCPIYAVNSNNNTIPSVLVSTAAVGSSGNRDTIYSANWATNNVNIITPPLTYIVTSDPSGGSTQMLTISVKSIYQQGTCPIRSPSASVTFTCIVFEVSK